MMINYSFIGSLAFWTMDVYKLHVSPRPSRRGFGGEITLNPTIVHLNVDSLNRRSRLVWKLLFLCLTIIQWAEEW